MKKIIIPFCICLILSIHTKAQVLQQLQNFDYGPYLNHPINNLLPAMPVGYTISPVRSRHGSPNACEIWLHYPGNINLEIIVTQFQFMNPYSINRVWDATLFKQENIKRVKLYNGMNKCLLGCTP